MKPPNLPRRASANFPQSSRAPNALGAFAPRLVIVAIVFASSLLAQSSPASFATKPATPAQTPAATISPARPVPSGLAPGMESKLLRDTPAEKVYAIVFKKGDEVLSGLTDFAIAHSIEDAHFTAIGAVSSATVGWLDLAQKQYRAIPVNEQVEVLSLIGDVATFGGKPVVHGHLVLGRSDGSTVGGHLWEAHVNPTLEVFLTANTTPLKKKLEPGSGMKVIAPAD